MTTPAGAGLPSGPAPQGMRRYFPMRHAADELDVVSLLYHGLADERGAAPLVFEGAAQERAALAGLVARAQAWLRARGLKQGDRVALMLANSLEHMALIYALILSGMVWVPVNTRLRGAGLRYVFEHAQPALIVSGAEFEADVGAALPPGRVRLTLPASQPFGGPAAPLWRADVRDGDVLCLLYTSGTTGAPKGVLFTHRMMRIAAESVLIVADVQAGDRLFMWEPLCHIGGAQLLLLPFMLDVQLHAVGRFSASGFWQQWRDARATHLHYLGGVLDILVRADAQALPPPGSVRVAWGAGLSAAAWATVQQRLGCRIRECYGMTEGSSFATCNATGKPGSIGRPLPWVRIELLDGEGKAVAPGEIGEIVISSELEGALFTGYFNNPEATASARRGGRLHTGDLARLDPEGDYVFVGRLTDSMRVRGENVSAWEVERVFLDHDAVEACAAVGTRAEVGEQDILLYVQFKQGQRVQWEHLAQWAAARMARFQLPRYYRATPGFELTPSERIRKHLLDREPDGAWDLLNNTKQARGA